MISKKNSWLAGVFLMALAVSAQEQTPSISGISHDPLRLGPISERKAPNNDIMRYGVILPFQVGPNMAAAFVNRGIYSASYDSYDSEDGTDLFLFDDVNKLQAKDAIPLNRSGVEPDPDYGGQKRYFNRYPVSGGFVPYGAKVNNQPHPHAGSGFGISQVITFPVAPNGTFVWESSPIDRTLEIFQFAYDGKKIQVISKEVRSATSSPLRVPNSQWLIMSAGMGVAIPDGCDLLLPAWAENGSGTCAGISRWSRIDGSWKVVAFIPVAYSNKQQSFSEPSLIRDIDGSLIFAARDDGRQNIKHPSWGTGLEQDINVWRSVDGGAKWSQIIHVEMVRSGPMSIGRSTDGIPFIVGNPIIKYKSYIHIRDLMYLWPLNSQRNTLEKPLVVRDLTKDFGKNNNGAWGMDHPATTILRLADGKLRAFLAYRVRDPHHHPVIPNKGISEPSAQAGSYLEEVISNVNGKPYPIWQFE